MHPPHAARRAVSAVFFVDGAALGGWAAHIPDVKAAFGLSDQRLGLTLLASAVGAVATMPLSGMLIHRFGSRRVPIFAGAGLCAAVPLLFLAPSWPLLVLFLALVGVTNGQMDVAMNAHSMAVQDRFERPVLSAIHGWFSVGGFAGGAGAALATKMGASPLAHLTTASLVFLLVLGMSARHLLGSAVDKGEGGSRLAFPNGSLWLLGVLALFAFVSEGAVWDWTAVYFREGLRTPTWLGALAFGLTSLAMAGGRFLGDRWNAALGPRRLLVLSALASGGGVLLAVSLPTPPLALLGFAVAGLGMSNLVPILFRTAASVPGITAGFGLAAVTTCGYSGFLGGPPLVGLIAHERSLGFALGGAAILCLLIAVASRWIGRFSTD